MTLIQKLMLVVIVFVGIGWLYWFFYTLDAQSNPKKVIQRTRDNYFEAEKLCGEGNVKERAEGIFGERTFVCDDYSKTRRK